MSMVSGLQNQAVGAVTATFLPGRKPGGAPPPSASAHLPAHRRETWRAWPTGRPQWTPPHVQSAFNAVEALGCGDSSPVLVQMRRRN